MNAKNTVKRGMRLYNDSDERLYINAAERARFIDAAQNVPEHMRTFCLTLLYTGCRLSEARALTTSSLQEGDNLLAFRSLKKRGQHHIREIPIPVSLVQSLARLGRKTENAKDGGPKNNPSCLWASETGGPIDRITAYRWVKGVMQWANIHGPLACPKGLRHGYGIHAIRSGITLNMLCRWMGHSSIEVTAIYANAVGPEEMELAERMWT